MSLSLAGVPLGVPNRSLALGMWLAVRIAAIIPGTRLRPSSIRAHLKLFLLRLSENRVLNACNCSSVRNSETLRCERPS
jgi:hypothetical protein